jgi:hypothetical protein
MQLRGHSIKAKPGLFRKESEVKWQREEEQKLYTRFSRLQLGVNLWDSLQNDINPGVYCKFIVR